MYNVNLEYTVISILMSVLGCILIWMEKNSQIQSNENLPSWKVVSAFYLMVVFMPIFSLPLLIIANTYLSIGFVVICANLVISLFYYIFAVWLITYKSFSWGRTYSQAILPDKLAQTYVMRKIVVSCFIYTLASAYLSSGITSLIGVYTMNFKQNSLFSNLSFFSIFAILMLLNLGLLVVLQKIRKGSNR